MAGVALTLSGQVALITGGSRGIGAATVKMFAAAGAQVAFNYRAASHAAEELVKQVGSHTCAAFPADLDAPTAARDLVTRTVERFGRLDVLVANHGIWPPDDIPIDRMSDEQWHKTVAVNLDSVFGLVKHSVAQMKKQGSGSVVLISSTAGQRGEAFHCDYAATKGAIISMVKGLSTELAPHHIRVNCVAPGWVDTDMTRDVLQSQAREAIMSKIPIGRVATPEEIAGPVLFLCTAHAGFITGEIFNVNGGAVLSG
jgi:3-oxoacyl-[acyl-carrier protein] reductase